MTTTRIGKVGHEGRIRDLRGMVERDPLNVNRRFMLAAALEAAGRMEEAVRELATAVEKGRRNLGVAHCNYAVALMRVGRPEEALRHFDQAIEVDPGNASFYLSNKAHALSELGLEDKAKAIYEQVLRSKDISKETQRIVVKKMSELGNKKK